MGVNFNGFYWTKDLYRTALPVRDILPLSDPIHHMIQGFKRAIDHHQPAFLTPQIAQRIYLISSRKEIYYASAKFGFLIKLISMMRNYWRFGCFETSAALGIKWSAPYIHPEPAPVPARAAVPAPAPVPVRAAVPVPALEPVIEDPEEEEEDIFYDCELELEEGDEVEIRQLPPPLQQAPLPPAALPVDPPVPPVVLTPKDEFLNTLEFLWEDNDQMAADIRQVFHYIFFKADFLTFQQELDGAFRLRIDKEVEGKFIGTPIGAKVFIKPEQTLIFSQTDAQKTVEFPSDNLIIRVGYGFISQDFYLKKVSVIDDRLLVEANLKGKRMTGELKMVEGMEYWKNVKWS